MLGAYYLETAGSTPTNNDDFARQRSASLSSRRDSTLSFARQKKIIRAAGTILSHVTRHKNSSSKILFLLTQIMNLVTKYLIVG
jgi:hypothetical protein